MANITVLDDNGDETITDSIETAVLALEFVGGLITLPENNEWLYVPPLEVWGDTTIVVTNGGTATLKPSEQTSEPLISSTSDAIQLFANNIHFTGVISNCDVFAGHAFRYGLGTQTFTNCHARGFTLRGFGMTQFAASPPIGCRLTDCTAESDLTAESFPGKGDKNLVGYLFSSSAQQADTIEVIDCSVGLLLGGSGDGIALKASSVDQILINNFDFEQDTQRIVLGSGVGQIRFAGFVDPLGWSRGLADWLENNPNPSTPEIHTYPLELIFQVEERTSI